MALGHVDVVCGMGCQSGFGARCWMLGAGALGRPGARASGREMHGKNWSKLCRDCQVIDGRSVTVTDVDIVFSKIKCVLAPPGAVGGGGLGPSVSQVGDE